MRLITRADLDGIACAVLISEVEDIDEIIFSHPRDMQNGLIEVNKGDAIANLPYHPNAALWFDHHDKAQDLPDPMPEVRGKCGIAPSAAHLINLFYDDPKFKKYEYMLYQTDRVDSANLEIEDVTDPKDWVLLSYTLDPRTMLGGFREYSLMVIQTILDGTPIEEILELPAVKERVDMFAHDDSDLKEALNNCSEMRGKVIFTDFRSIDKIPAGGRFLVFAMFPEGTVQVRLHWNHKKDRIVMACGKSIFDRSCEEHVGHLMSKYGGGGLAGAGTCDFDPADTDRIVDEVVAQLNK